MILYEITVQYKWQEKSDETAKYTFATRKGAERWIKRQIAKGEAMEDAILWYAIEGFELLPSIEAEPDGQLYYGVIYYDYKDLREGADADKE